MNPTLNKSLHALLSQTGLMAQKKNLVSGYTHGRTESSREMTDWEARELIKYLQTQKAPVDKSCEKKRRKLIALSYSIGENENFIKGWCEKYGVNGNKRKFNDYSKQELHLLIDKFQKTVIENRIK